MRRYPQSSGKHPSGGPDCHHTANGSGGPSDTGHLGAFRNHAQSFAKHFVAPQDFFPLQQILNPHPVALFRCRGILTRNALVGEQLQIVLRRRYADIETRRHLAPRCRTILGQKPDDGHSRQVPERVNDRLQMSGGLRMGIPGHTCNLAVPVSVLAYPHHSG